MRRLLFPLVIAACGDAPAIDVGPDAGASSDAGIEPESDALDPPAPSLVPSNSDVFGELEPTGLVVRAPDGAFDTDRECQASAALGTCEVVARPDAGEACVCRSDELTIGTLHVTGSRALVLLALRRVRVETLLDVSAHGSTDGPGASRKFASSVSGLAAGAGGSYTAYGAPALVPLLGGMRGQSSGGAGGGAGGALQITAGEHLAVDGTIDAGGGGGAGGIGSYSYAGAGGGGSGGAILLEAPTVALAGALTAHGGGGGGGGGNDGSGGRGDDGNLAAAYGGYGRDGDGCPLYGYVSGGDGGRGATGNASALAGQSYDTDSRCIGSTSFVGAGGDGGGVGRIRINTKTGCDCSGMVSPNASFGSIP